MSILLAMLGVIGTILKWILLIVLGIIALVILLLIIIFSVPVGYDVRGEKPEEDFGSLQLRAKISWLLHLVRVPVTFQSKELKWMVKVAWFNVASSDSSTADSDEDAAADVEQKADGDAGAAAGTIEEPQGDVKAEADKKVDAVDTDIGKKTGTDEDADVFKSDDVNIGAPVDQRDDSNIGADAHVSADTHAETDDGLPAESEGETMKRKSMLQRGLDMIFMKPEELLAEWKQERREAAANREKEQLAKKEASEKRRLEKEAQRKEKEEARARAAEEKAAKVREKTEQSKEKEQAKAEVKALKAKKRAEFLENLPDYMEKFWDIFEAVLDAPGEIENILEEKIGPSWDKFQKYKRMFDRYPRKAETLKALLMVPLRMLKPFVPRQYEGTLDFGTGDPADTAKILGLYYSLMPLVFPRQDRRHHWEATANLQEKTLIFDVRIKGHFSINSVVVWPLARALFNKDILRLMRFAWRLYKNIKKEKEQQEGE
ncbi:MAG: DUF2953 domain-containing protein [Lachnospiraceae bacterium]|nr:DUF2953 domain-containing protein [Lachnospiraceae bacterium]